MQTELVGDFGNQQGIRSPDVVIPSLFISSKAWQGNEKITAVLPTYAAGEFNAPAFPSSLAAQDFDRRWLIIPFHHAALPNLSWDLNHQSSCQSYSNFDYPKKGGES